MVLIHFLALTTIIGMCYGIYRMKNFPKGFQKDMIYAFFFLALLLRCALACFYKNVSDDTLYYADMTYLAYENKLSDFYAANVAQELTPFMTYLFMVQGAVYTWLGIPYLSGAFLLILKLPSIVCDLVAGIFLFKMCRTKYTEGRATLFAALYLFNPVVIMDSSVWGQFDSFYTLAALLMCYFLTKKKVVPAIIAFGAGLFCTPLMLWFFPVLILGFLDRIVLHDFSVSNLLRHLSIAVCVFCCLLLLCIPLDFGNVLTKYYALLTSHGYAAVNAFNFWGMLGQNWIAETQISFLFSYAQLGVLITAAVIACVACIFFKMKNMEHRYYVSAATIVIFLFAFSTGMHERYLFPALLLLLAAYLSVPHRQLYLGYIVFSVLTLYNMAYALLIYDYQNYNRKAFIIIFFSAAMVLSAFFYGRFLYRQVKLQEGSFPLPPFDFYALWGKEEVSGEKRFRFRPVASVQALPVTRIDVLIVLVSMGVYSFFAFRDLGDMQAPQTEYLMQEGDSIEFRLEEGSNATTLYWYLGYEHNCDFSLEYIPFGQKEWITANGFDSITMSHVFRWDSAPLPAGCEYIRLTCHAPVASVFELAVTDGAGKVVMPVNAPEYETLFDEAALFPEEISFRNGTYFDEIYYARTAYEFLHGLDAYENTHPPLGKVILSAGIAIFGMTPFGWRFMGTLFGILMLPVLYAIARELFKDRIQAGFACLLFAVDFMHFTQTRIATIDVFVTFFILLMYYFMYKYCQMSFYDTALKKTWVPLGFCGIAMGLGIACKWTGVYAAAGLAVLFFVTLYRRYREYRFALESPEESSNGIEHERIIRLFKPAAVKTCVFCIAAFVIVPLILYTVSYIPFRDGDSSLITRMAKNQSQMFSYHSGLKATHPYSSSWEQWPMMIRPVFYYAGNLGGEYRQGISAFGNPLVWWVGIPAFLYLLYLVIRRRDRISFFIVIGYLAQYLPWCLVPRLTFLYHYFPSVPFVVLMIAYAAERFKRYMNERSYLTALGIYAAAAVALFMLFYPVIAGQTVTTTFVSQYLRWLDTWALVL